MAPCACLVVLLGFLYLVTDSVTINCDGIDPCECTEPGPCTLDCYEEQACQDAVLLCRAYETCDIICDGDGGNQACEGADIYAKNSTDVTLTCTELEDCKDVDIECGTGINKKLF